MDFKFLFLFLKKNFGLFWCLYSALCCCFNIAENILSAANEQHRNHTLARLWGRAESAAAPHILLGYICQHFN